jgi:predicted DNA binding protein
VIGELRDRYPDLDIKRFVRSPGRERTADGVYVDRSRLTERQQTVLRKAFDMGYFERPRRANASEVAAQLDINPSTFSEHMVTAQHKLLEMVLDR